MNTQATPAQAPAGLLGWPYQLPIVAAQAVADAQIIQALEFGPVQWRDAWQSQRLAQLLAWVGQGDTWRSWLARAQSPSGPAGMTLQHLPVMDRATFRAMTEAVSPRVPASHGAVNEQATSGSTGVPVRFWFSAIAARLNASHYWHDHQRQGRDLRAEMATISGRPAPHTDSHVEVAGDDWLHPGKQLVRHAYSFSVEENAHWLCTYAPTYLVTHPGLLSGMLSVIEDKGLTAPHLQQVMTFSETVEPELRERTRRILGARIADRYSCQELGPLAFQCPHSEEHYHVASANVIVEVVDEHGQALPYGELGSVLATGLHQWASPAVRYELGDVAAMLPHCPACSATAPTLTKLLGRKSALVTRADGSLHYVRVLAKHWHQCAPVLENRLVQTAPLAFRVELVGERPFTQGEMDAIRNMLAARIGSEFEFDIQQLEAIPWPMSRKRQEVEGLR